MAVDRPSTAASAAKSPEKPGPDLSVLLAAAIVGNDHTDPPVVVALRSVRATIDGWASTDGWASSEVATFAAVPFADLVRLSARIGAAIDVMRGASVGGAS
jgi:hypothetical protein